MMPGRGIGMIPPRKSRVRPAHVFLCILRRQLENLLGCLLAHILSHELLRVECLGNLVRDVHRVVHVLDVLKLI